MSRSHYSDDYEHMNLWANTVNRALKGKRGQAFLKEMIAALDAMPEKKLIDGYLVDCHGRVCALGAVGTARKLPMKDIDYEDPETVARLFGISTAMVQEIVYMNDEWHTIKSDEDRWQYMRKWCSDNIIKGEA